MGFPGRPGGEGPVREVVGGSEAAVVVHQQFADAGAGLDERAEGVEGLGEGEGVLQRAAGRGPFAGGDRDRGFQQPGLDDGGRQQYGSRSVQDRADQGARVFVVAPRGLGPAAHDQQIPAVADAVGQPAEDGPRRCGVPEEQGGANSSAAIEAYCCGLVWWSPNSERARCSSASSEFGDHHTSPQQCASMAMLEFRAALLLGHAAAARTVLAWLTDRIGDREISWSCAAWPTAGGRREHARALIRTVLDGSAAVLLPASVVDAWLLETSIAVAAGERPAARRALQNALAFADPLDALRPFVQAGPGVRELLVHHHGSFGASDDFARRVLAAGPVRETQQALLSERELTVLGLPPSMLSLDEIAADLTESVNAVQEPRPIDLRQARREQPPARRARRPEHGLLNSAR